VIPSLAQIASSCAARSSAIARVNSAIKQERRGPMQAEVLTVLYGFPEGATSRQIADSLGVYVQRVDDAIRGLVRAKVVSRVAVKRKVERQIGLKNVWLYKIEESEDVAAA
jgi:hypothetical protein